MDGKQGKSLSAAAVSLSPKGEHIGLAQDKLFFYGERAKCDNHLYTD